ncbi:helix-turn-helix domain-containing protein [Acetobacterium malicum]|uniref:Helix-turn-helix domain-containing protein n=1 Tax=Acetobacterium malicum TaxID=52692 RepID=A0ABR6YUH7_9FIRM|nr:helix-turn-helix transcriptional regulator [Acetobacterium malicum]MBC3898847.1 helix-turn-helix domain-containing protein [Acetobacterium malicum]
MSQEIGNVLKDMIKEKNMTVFSLAKEVDVDRSTFQHFLSGKRKLNLEDLRKIMIALNLSKDKKKQLYTLYENEYDDREVLKNSQDIFSLFGEIDQLNPEKEWVETEEYLVKNQLASEKARIIKGQVKIEGIIRSCFMEEMGRGANAHVIMSVNFKHYFLYDLIMRVNGQNQGGKIQNIIPLVNKKKLGNNLDILKTVLLLKRLDNIDYEPYYFYSGTKIYDDISIIVPNYFITSKQVITIDRDFESAIIYEDPEILEYYREKSQSILSKCEFFVEKELLNTIIYSPSSFEKIMKNNITEKYIAFDRLDSLIDQDHNSGEKANLTAQLQSPEKGCVRISETFVLRDGLITGNRNLCIRYLVNEERVDFILINETKSSILKLTVKEIGIVLVFREFFNYLPHSVHVCSPEEIKNGLRNIRSVTEGIENV